MQAAVRVDEFIDEAPQLTVSQEHLLLVSRIIADQDRDAFKTLFVYFGPRIKAMMLKSGATFEQSEDIVQIVMLTIWRKLHQFSAERGSLEAWIFTIARNARVDRIRRGASRIYQDIDDMELKSDAPDSSDELYASQCSKKVASVLQELPNEQREIIELAFMEDISQSEIAKRLSIPLGTVKSRMRLAYVKLKDRLKELR